MPSSVVGTWTTAIPRWYTAAANPPTSVTIPPPTATTASVRVRPIRAKWLQRASTVARRLGLLAVAEQEGVAGDAGVDVDRDAVLGDDRDAPHAGGQHVGQQLAHAPADDHLVGPIADGHADADHGAPHPASTASTSSSTDRPSTSTTTSATSA